MKNFFSSGILLLAFVSVLTSPLNANPWTKAAANGDIWELDALLFCDPDGTEANENAAAMWEAAREANQFEVLRWLVVNQIREANFDRIFDFQPPPAKLPRERCFCPIDGCKRSYVRKGDLKFHVAAKHPDYPEELISRSRSSTADKAFLCPIRACPCGFSHKRDFQRHFRLKHGDQAVEDRRESETFSETFIELDLSQMW